MMMMMMMIFHYNKWQSVKSVIFVLGSFKRCTPYRAQERIIILSFVLVQQRVLSDVSRIYSFNNYSGDNM